LDLVNSTSGAIGAAAIPSSASSRPFTEQGTVVGQSSFAQDPKNQQAPAPDSVNSRNQADDSQPCSFILDVIDDSNKEESKQDSSKEKEETSEDKKFLKAEIRGRIEADAIMASQTPKDKAAVGDLQNVVGFRRARLGAQGDAGDQVHWVAEFDFASGSVVLRDVYLSVDKLPLVREIRVGNFQEPFSLEGATSSNYFPFCERSIIMSYDPAYHWGVGMFSYTENQRATVQVGAFRSGSGSDGTDSGDANDMQYTDRITGLLWCDCTDNSYRLMHLGGAFSTAIPKNHTFTFNQGTQNSLLKSSSDNALSPFQPDITIPASNYQLYNVQWALVLNSLSFEAEWTAAEVDQIGGGPVFLNGCYGFMSFFLTGEHRQYNTRYGEFTMTRVNRPFFLLGRPRCCGCGPGAWELTARFAYNNLLNSNLPPASNGLPQGSRLAETTVGVNWYLNDYARIMFNYVNAVPIIPAFGPSGANAFFIELAIFW
jgi:phosphate-selective porin OprO/OprP